MPQKGEDQKTDPMPKLKEEDEKDDDEEDKSDDSDDDEEEMAEMDHGKNERRNDEGNEVYEKRRNVKHVCNT